MKKIKWFLIHLLRRIAYYLEHGSDKYGTPGFEVLSYKGTPFLVRDYVPKDEVWGMDSKGNVTQVLNIKTGLIKKQRRPNKDK